MGFDTKAYRERKIKIVKTPGGFEFVVRKLPAVIASPFLKILGTKEFEPGDEAARELMAEKFSDLAKLLFPTCILQPKVIMDGEPKDGEILITDIDPEDGTLLLDAIVDIDTVAMESFRKKPIGNSGISVVEGTGN